MRRGTLFIVVLLALAFDARAQQCGSNLSQCRNCHEVRGERPVLAGPLPWHVDHAFADFCARCHGGNPRAADAPAAHVGVSSPLTDVAGRCAPCHPSDASQKAQRYLNFVPLSRATPTPTPRVSSAAPCSARETDERPKIVWGNVALALTALILALGGIRLIVWNEQRLQRAQGGATP